MYLIFDTETTGLPKRYNAPVTDTENWPRCVQLAWQLHDGFGKLIEQQDFLIRPDGFTIPFESESIHGISTELATAEGIKMQTALDHFISALGRAKVLVGQNLDFDINIMGCELFRYGYDPELLQREVLDTCTEQTAELCQLPGGRGGKFKLPTLSELHQHLFGTPFEEAHNASADVEATARCFFELVRTNFFTAHQLPVDETSLKKFREAHPQPFPAFGIQHRNLKQASETIRKSQSQQDPKLNLSQTEKDALAQAPFAHLHTHSRFSVLQATSTFSELVEAAAQYQMPALALTDIGNLMGAFLFVKEVDAYNKKALSKSGETPFEPIKPIVGCSMYVCENHLDRSHKDNGYQMVFFGKKQNRLRQPL